MCGCEQHHDDSARCTCICDEHRNFEAARDLAFSRYDTIVALQQELEAMEGKLAQAWDEGWRAAQEVVDLDGHPAWAHTVYPEGYEGNPYKGGGSNS